MKRRLASVPPLAWLLLLTLLCLVPFINKAFHIDDTLFLRAAEQIRAHPADFYGFDLNWFGTSSPMIKVFENPPLTCYYLALAGWLAGWSEPALHLAFLLPALAVAWGCFSLARNYCARPLLAGVVAVLTPVFLISATTLMCDVMLVAFWVWSLACFEKGLQANRRGAFLLSGLLAGLAVLTKFPGLALVPLLAVYGLARQRRLGGWLLAPLIPLLFAGAYEWITYRLYGHGLLLAAAGYASASRTGSALDHLEQAVLGLGYAGGCFLPVLFYAPRLWSRRTLFAGIFLLVPCLVLPLFAGTLKPILRPADGSLNWVLLLQCALFAFSGFHLLLLIVADCRERRDPVSLFLLCWTLGVLVFTVAINWVTNGRSLLPMAPALGILVARRWERQTSRTSGDRGWWLVPPTLLAAVVSLLLARADYNLANSGRTAARELCAKYLRPGNTLWFEGHWGFQYYMEQLGAQALDLKLSRPCPEDVVVLPPDYSNIYDLPSELLRFVELLAYAPNLHLTTMSRSVDAGFYAAGSRPLPFALGPIEPERFYVFQFIRISPAELQNLGPAHFTALAHEEAITRKITHFQNAILAHPDDADAHYQLGRLLASRAQILPAAAQFLRVLDLKPDDGPAHLELAGLMDRLQRTPEAVTHYRAALRAMPDSVEAMNDLASILATDPRPQLRNGPEAVALAGRANDLTGHKSAMVLSTLAQACAEAGRFDDAITAANQAIDLAEAAGDHDFASANRQALELFRAHRPYHAGDLNASPKNK